MIDGGQVIVNDRRASSGASDGSDVPRADEAWAAQHTADEWVNTLLGFGGARDKTEATTYCGIVMKLPDPVLAAMYATEDLSAKIVDVYPREALREGYELGGFDPEQK